MCFQDPSIRGKRSAHVSLTTVRARRKKHLQKSFFSSIFSLKCLWRRINHSRRSLLLQDDSLTAAIGIHLGSRCSCYLRDAQPLVFIGGRVLLSPFRSCDKLFLDSWSFAWGRVWPWVPTIWVARFFTSCCVSVMRSDNATRGLKNGWFCLAGGSENCAWHRFLVWEPD